MDDAPNGGKVCSGTMGKFNINSNGDCDDDKGCSLAVSGPMCPGISRGTRDLKGGNRECILDTTGMKFEIGKDGKCIDSAKCAPTVAELAKEAAAKLKKSGMKKRSNKRSNKRSKRSKMCYMRKSKGKKSHTKVCMSKSAKERLVKGARKGGRNSHK
jgi:hypothetical protein